MGRTRTKSKKPLLSVDKAPTVTSTKSEPSITSLLEKVQALIVQCNYELALKFAKRIVDREPKHAEAREMFGVCLLEMGELDGAIEVRRSSSVSGDSPGSDNDEGL
jgi:Flp pilus assembly protein TadD